MRLKMVTLFSLLFLSAGVSLAQGWIKYVDRAERFIVNFPGEPEIEDISYISHFNATFPARVYTVEQGSSRYSVTVINYTEAERAHRELCEQPGHAGECDGFEIGTDVRGSIAWEAWNIRKRGGEITHDAFAQVDRIPGHQLQITDADQSRTFVGIYLEGRRLYVLEATVPGEAPPPIHFQQSLGILDAEGKRVVYSWDFNNNKTRVEASYEWIGDDDSVPRELQVE